MTKIDDRNEAVAYLARVFETSRVRSMRIAAGRYVDVQVKLEAGVDEWTFNRSAYDGRWRWTYKSTYGNGSFIHGDGCDATGLKIPADFVETYIAPLAEFETVEDSKAAKSRS